MIFQLGDSTPRFLFPPLTRLDCARALLAAPVAGEKPSAEAKEALKIKPVKKKMINKSKGDARLDGLINSFETTSAGMAARANVRKARVNPFEGKELGEQLPGVTFHRKAISIGTALG